MFQENYDILFKSSFEKIGNGHDSTWLD